MGKVKIEIDRDCGTGEVASSTTRRGALLYKSMVAVELCAVAAASFAGIAPERTHVLKVPAKMEMLRPGEVKPQGWLRDWCVTARDGYVSRMDEIDQAFPRAWSRDFHPRGKYLDWSDPNKGAWCAEGGAYWFEGLVDVAPGGKANVYNTQYETFGVRRVRDDPRHVRSQVLFGDGTIETHLSIAWENYAGRLPEDGCEWEFEALRWGGSGNAAWNGTESIHGRSTWGRLKFSLPAAARNAIRRRQICAAAAAYRREKTVGTQFDGVLSWWEDPGVGDLEFYERGLKPLVARLDALAERARPEMSDAEAASFSDADLSALLDVKFEVARRRRDWLEELLFSGWH